MSPLDRFALNTIGVGAAIGAVLGFIFGGFTLVSTLWGVVLTVSLFCGGLIGVGKEDEGQQETILPRVGFCFAMLGAMAISASGGTILLTFGALVLGVAVCSIATGINVG